MNHRARKNFHVSLLQYFCYSLLDNISLTFITTLLLPEVKKRKNWTKSKLMIMVRIFSKYVIILVRKKKLSCSLKFIKNSENQKLLQFKLYPSIRITIKSILIMLKKLMKIFSLNILWETSFYFFKFNNNSLYYFLFYFKTLPVGKIFKKYTYNL